MSDQAVQALTRSRTSRSAGLRKLGVSESDVHLAEKLLHQTVQADPARSKALRMLGATENDVAMENSKMLGSLGVAGRRRSYSIVEPPSQSEILALARAIPKARSVWVRRKSSDARRRHTLDVKRAYRRMSIGKRRRSSDGEVRRLRNQTLFFANENQALRAKIDELERRLSEQSGTEDLPP
ncbi:hypothetical protein ACHAXT_009992 [Thalassiosira profunda]